MAAAAQPTAQARAVAISTVRRFSGWLILVPSIAVADVGAPAAARKAVNHAQVPRAHQTMNRPEPMMRAAPASICGLGRSPQTAKPSSMAIGMPQ